MIFLEEQVKKPTGKKNEVIKGKKIEPPKIEYLEHKDVDKATEVAIFYGFTPITVPTINKEDEQKGKAIRKTENIADDVSDLASTPEERIAMLRHFLEKGYLNQPQPTMLCYNGFIEQGANRKTTEKKIGLEIIGTSKCVAEAMSISTSLAILKEYGAKDLMVEINSLGDKESINRFSRELTTYFRKNINNLSAHCRQAFKQDALSVLACENKTCQDNKAEAPQAINCLSDASREHFKEVLEYLEKLSIPYQINNTLVGYPRIGSQTVFRITGHFGNNKTEQLAFGYRYDALSKKIDLKKEIPAVVTKIHFKNILKKDSVKKIKKPMLYFIQLGFEAKHKALTLIEILRMDNILVYQSLSRDKMGSQLMLAEKLRIPFVMIMGQKEALEDAVMIRNLKTRSQTTVPIKHLSEHIRNADWY